MHFDTAITMIGQSSPAILFIWKIISQSLSKKFGRNDSGQKWSIPFQAESTHPMIWAETT